MMASGLSSVRKINRLNINISVDAGELSALVVRCVDAPADSLRCVALEMRRGGGEKQEEEEREAGGEDVAYLRGSANDANLTPRKVTPRRIVFSIARVLSDFPATFPKLLTSVAAFYDLSNILLFFSPERKYRSSRYSKYISSGDEQEKKHTFANE